MVIIVLWLLMRLLTVVTILVWLRLCSCVAWGDLSAAMMVNGACALIGTRAVWFRVLICYGLLLMTINLLLSWLMALSLRLLVVRVLVKAVILLQFLLSRMRVNRNRQIVLRAAYVDGSLLATCCRAAVVMSGVLRAMGALLAALVGLMIGSEQGRD